MDQLLRYSELMDQLVDLMTVTGQFDLRRIYEVLTELSQMLRASKGVTSFYKTPEHAKLGKGERYVCYDSGAPSHLAMREQTVTATGMTAVCEVFQADGEPPFNEEERSRIHRIQRRMVSFMSRKRLSDEVERLTFYDDEGYRNIRYFMSHIGQMIRDGQIANKGAGRLNLRHLSRINRDIGRVSGNILMRNYISLLEEKIGDGGFVCRLGGDNFVFLCDRSSMGAVEYVLRGVPVVYDQNKGDRVVISAVAGLYLIPDNGEIKSPDEIMDNIISAYESARNDGKETIVYSTDALIYEKEKILAVQQAFPRAMQNEEFLVYYQPKIDVFGNEMTGAEALCRWYHEGKIISPAEFIPVLERNLDICKLDFYMLEHVCRDIRRWLDEGKKVVRVSVNFSRKHMIDADLFDHIVGIIDRYHVPHKYLEIELTETTTDVEFRDLKQMVNHLQYEGISTSVDDFGIGYSSLRLLKDIPWNVLKVDKSFLPNEDADETDRNSILFKYVIAMARELGLECIAEGVETKEQVKILRDNSCNIAQGFYYDKPLPVEDYEKRLDRNPYKSM
ncbi:MAG: GGDEF domain-containing protein [Clostridia bacterium]|nr:GGDEF domain-containing protein [Clostridia bacterium]